VPGILALNQDTGDAVHQYAIASLPSKALADLLFENRVARLFLRASPSVNEMALIGRIVQLVETHEANGPVIVDLHATGHALAMFSAPDGIMRVLRTGPVFERAREVREVLYDEKRCAVVTVAHPEELPVTELLEFHDKLDEVGVPLGPVFANGVFTDPAPGVPDDVLKTLAEGPKGSAADAAKDAMALRSWARRSARERDRLADGVAKRGLTVVSLPYVCDLSTSETLAGRLSDVLQARAEGHY
jgi:anion-transporting  ArsA/GET3 family ATPase